MPNHVIVSTLGWSKGTLEEAIAGIAALEFGQAELGMVEGWAHLDPSALAGGGRERVGREADRIRSLIARHQMRRVSAFRVGLGAPALEEQKRRLAAVCDLAAALEVPVIAIEAAPRGTPLADEVERLRALVPVAAERGVQVTVKTHVGQLTEEPAAAARLCEAVRGLGLTLDAGHYYAGPNRGADYSAVLPYVRHVHLRDAGLDWEHMQVPAGMGQVDFGWIVSALHAEGYVGKFAIEYIDAMPVVAPAGEPADIPANILRMRDVFVTKERAAGIVRTPPAPTPG